MQLLPSIELAERKAMLVLARDAINTHWTKESLPTEPLPHGELRQGCFVTLHEQGDLRGCIGTLEQDMPLQQAIVYFARAAAFQDPRFPPLTEKELPNCTISISILSSREALAATSREELLAALTPFTDGLWLSDGYRRATFLPAVWRQLPNKDDFIHHLLRKGGWQPDSWPPNMQAWRYHSLEFAEPDGEITIE